MYARPQARDTLGVSGMLWRDALIMYDRATNSLWSQINGEAVAGPMKGRRLQEMPSQLTTWGEWKRRHPETLVLTKPPLSGSVYEDYFIDPQRIGVRGSTNPDPRLAGKELVLGLERSGRFAAVPLHDVEAHHLINASAFGVPILVATSGTFERRIDGRALTFDSVDASTVRDRQSSSLWSTESGMATSGPMRGKRLERVSSKVVYWAVWARFHPNTELLVR